MSIQDRLFELQDLKYKAFQERLIPTLPPETIIGVRTPALRKLAKELSGSAEAGVFLSALPHRYFEENQLHSFIISGIKDMDSAVAAVDAFLPFVDNWATCDQLSPKAFGKHPDRLLAAIRRWLSGTEAYTIRFGIGMLMSHFLGYGFQKEYLDMVAKIRSEEYYVNMMIAWYFATALTKQYEAALAYIQGGSLDKWTHNKAIQKARESLQIGAEQKQYLNSLKI